MELADAEIAGAFVETEPNMNGLDVPKEIEAVQPCCINQGMACVIKREIVSNKSERLSCPDVCIFCPRDYIVADPFFQPSLGVFGNA